MMFSLQLRPSPDSNEEFGQITLLCPSSFTVVLQSSPYVIRALSDSMKIWRLLLERWRNVSVMRAVWVVFTFVGERLGAHLDFRLKIIFMHNFPVRLAVALCQCTAL